MAENSCTNRGACYDRTASEQKAIHIVVFTSTHMHTHIHKRTCSMLIGSDACDSVLGSEHLRILWGKAET